MERTCRETGTVFTVSPQDLDFYSKISPVFGAVRCEVPPPTLCPEARMRRRLTFRNERTLYRRRCDRSGREIISVYAPDAPHPVWETPLWYADDWDARDYGREYDPNRPFFEQFAELMKVVPMYSLSQRLVQENSPYTHLVSGNKNCHYIFAASDNEDCFYTTYIQRSRDVADSFFIFDSELCYECIDCYHGYGLRHCQECDHCTDSEHLLGCLGCRECFGCVSLTKAQHCLFNDQLTPAQYAAEVSRIKARPDCEQYLAQRRAELLQSVPRKYYSGINIEDSTGDHLANCRNARDCYDCTSLEDCRYCVWLHRGKDCYDCYAWGLSGELGLENHLVGNNFHRVLFSDECSNDVSNLLYCRGCFSRCDQLFGCIGLKRAKYCILNRQYSREEYERLVPHIIARMAEDGAWGEFFPQSLSPYGYNETVAAEYFPMTETEVRQRGWNWQSAPLPGVYGREAVSWADVPADIQEVSDDLADLVFRCEDSGKNFRFTKAELALYRKLRVPLPRRCFDARYRRRFALRNPRELHHRSCSECGQPLETSYGELRPERICCEGCFRNLCVR